jgi:hypothetical protein
VRRHGLADQHGDPYCVYEFFESSLLEPLVLVPQCDMKGILAVSVAVLVSAVGVSAQSSLSSLISELPSCAVSVP